MGLGTIFGWTVAGMSGRRDTESAIISSLSTDDLKLKEDLARIFNNDFPFIKDDGKKLSKEANYALKQLEKSVKWDEKNRRYTSGIPCKKGREEASKVLNSVDSKATAERRMWSLKRSMEKLPEKKKKGFSEMKKFVEKGRAIELTLEEDMRQKEAGLPILYLPCHLVFQHQKYRFCHDGRSETRGICLNEQVIGVLNLMVPLIDQINNLRRHLYSFTTDIEAFFHTIGVDERDRGAFRFLWFDDERMLMLREYLFLAFIFGSSASSSVTSYMLKTSTRSVNPKQRQTTFQENI